MKRQFIIMLATTMLAACNSNNNGESKVREAFEEYVRTDFGNPKNYVQITQFCDKDTIDKKFLLSKMEHIIADTVLPNSMRWERDRILNKLKNDSTFIIDHKIKVRLRDGDGNYSIKEYHVIERNGEFSVQDHAITSKEIPSVYNDALLLMNDYVDGLRAFEQFLEKFGNSLSDY